jgi:HEAT repeat protein
VAAVEGPSGIAARALVAALAEGDAAVRAAAAEALADATEAGLRGRSLAFQVLPLLKDRDPRVRAAAVRAAAGLDAASALSELVLALAREKDTGVLVAWSRALAAVPGKEALAQLERQARSTVAEVRRQAIGSLTLRPEPEARTALALLAADADPAVRAAAFTAVDDAQVIRGALSDAAAEVRAAALTALVRAAGTGALADAMRAIARAATPHDRLHLAESFLVATGEGRH